MIKVSIALPEQGLNTGQRIRAIHLEFNQPGFVALIGRNGSGKSTLLQALSGLLLCKGEIFFSSAPAYLPQQMPIPWGLTARDVVAMGAYHQSEWRTTLNYNRADTILENWGLASLSKQEVATLSGGERQLVWLAQMEMQDASILLLDEPTQYLDVYFQAKVFEWMRAQVDAGKLIICVTHQLDYAVRMPGVMLNLSDPIIRLEDISAESIDLARKSMERN